MTHAFAPIDLRRLVLVEFTLLLLLLSDYRSFAWSRFPSFASFFRSDRRTTMTADDVGSQVSETVTASAPSTFKILGVAGGIGSGKSTACTLLASELGCAAHIGE
jgi:hypothetical protein